MRKFGWLGVLVTVLAVAACGPTSDGTAGDGATKDGGSAGRSSGSTSDDGASDAGNGNGNGAPRVDTPVKFAGKPVKFRPSVITEVAPRARESFATLRGTTAYIVGGNGFGAYDLPTGKELWKVPGPKYVSGLPMKDAIFPTWPSGPMAPAVSDDGTTVAAVLPYYTEAGENVRVIVADAKSGNVQLTKDILLPVTYQDSWNGDVTTVYARVLGLTDRQVIFTAGLDWNAIGTKYTFALDRATRKVAWSKPHFGASGVSGSRVIGTISENGGMSVRVQALDAATGKPSWNVPRALGLSLQQPYAGTVLVTDKRASQQGTVTFLDAATGKPKGQDRTVPNVPTSGAFLTCFFDQKATQVCVRNDLSTDPTRTIFTGYDAATGRQLWQKALTSRSNEPTGTAWHGAVYVDNGTGGTIILDARTGGQKASFEDLDAPSYVDADGGLRLEDDFSMTFLPATG